MLNGRTIPVTVPIALKDFSQQIGVKTSTLLLHLMKQGVMANPNTSLDEETVLVLAEAFKRTVDVSAAKTVEEELEQLLETREAESEGDLKGRPPVVTVLGHVDHGKTSLLDHIRKTRVAAGEAGGITQHIGAYRVDLSRGKSLTFLDTPGHEAFTAMRARGAKITDIAILVVAADDGVMPQTEEAIAHVRAAQVPIVVAINKCDRSNAQPERARQQLSAANLMPEEWGGDVAMINVSAVTGDGIKELLERVSLEAELLDLHASPDHPAEGYVVEARKQTGKGVVATLLVKNGTLHRGDYILSGTTQGKIKSLMDDRGKQVKNAGPSMPVEVTGFDDVPEAGWRFQVLRDKELAKKVASERSQRQRELDLASKAHTSFEKLMDRIESRELPELRLVVKADVKGSLEALKGKLEAIGTDEVQVKILHTGVGGVTESDVLLAQASEALVLGFHVVPDGKARQTAERTGVEIRTSQVIYELLEDMQKAVEGLLPTETEEVIVGHAEIRQLFRHARAAQPRGPRDPRRRRARLAPALQGRRQGGQGGLRLRPHDRRLRRRQGGRRPGVLLDRGTPADVVAPSMHVGVLQVELALEKARSLKEKRQVVKSVVDRARASFNVSAAEVADLDLHQSAILGFSAVSNDAQHVRGLLQKLVNHLQRHPVARVVDHQLEVL
jgi:translation initiation factor IF-2